MTTRRPAKLWMTPPCQIRQGAWPEWAVCSWSWGRRWRVTWPKSTLCTGRLTPGEHGKSVPAHILTRMQASQKSAANREEPWLPTYRKWRNLTNTEGWGYVARHYKYTVIQNRKRSTTFWCHMVPIEQWHRSCQNTGGKKMWASRWTKTLHW